MYCPSCNTPNPVYHDYCGNCHLALDGSGNYECGYSPEAIAGRKAEQLQAEQHTDHTLSYVEKKHSLEQRHKSGSGWFYWIAGMTMVNTAMLIFGSSTRFVTGLGVTTFFEAVALEFSKTGSSLANIAKALAVLIDFASIGAFILFAVYSRKGKPWAYITGMAIYAIDTLILLLFQDWMTIAFHVWAIFGLFTGFRAFSELRKLLPPQVPEPQTVEAPENLEAQGQEV